MLISQELAKSFVEQIGVELHNALTYHLFGVWFDVRGMTDWAAKMRESAGEEQGHATRFQQFLSDCDVKFDMPAVPTVAMPEAMDAAGIMGLVLELEQATTQRVLAMQTKACEAYQWPAFQFLLSFVAEQVQSEANVRNWAVMLETGVSPYLVEPAVAV